MWSFFSKKKPVITDPIIKKMTEVNTSPLRVESTYHEFVAMVGRDPEKIKEINRHIIFYDWTPENSEIYLRWRHFLRYYTDTLTEKTKFSRGENDHGDRRNPVLVDLKVYETQFAMFHAMYLTKIFLVPATAWPKLFPHALNYVRNFVDSDLTYEAYSEKHRTAFDQLVVAERTRLMKIKKWHHNFHNIDTASNL